MLSERPQRRAKQTLSDRGIPSRTNDRKPKAGSIRAAFDLSRREGTTRSAHSTAVVQGSVSDSEKEDSSRLPKTVVESAGRGARKRRRLPGLATLARSDARRRQLHEQRLRPEIAFVAPDKFLDRVAPGLRSFGLQCVGRRQAADPARHRPGSPDANPPNEPGAIRVADAGGIERFLLQPGNRNRVADSVAVGCDRDRG